VAGVRQCGVRQFGEEERLLKECYRLTAVNGALAHIKTKVKTDFLVFHCRAHKLELVIKRHDKTSDINRSPSEFD